MTEEFFIIAAHPYARHKSASAAERERARLAERFPSRRFTIYRCIEALELAATEQQTTDESHD